MKASDVVFSFKEQPPPTSTNVSYIMSMVDPDGLEIVDDYTVIVRYQRTISLRSFIICLISELPLSIEKAYTEDEEGCKRHILGDKPVCI